MDDLVRQGKVRYIGTTTYAAWQIVESLWVSKEHGLNRFVCEQPPYNLLDRRIEPQPRAQFRHHPLDHHALHSPTRRYGSDGGTG